MQKRLCVLYARTSKGDAGGQDPQSQILAIREWCTTKGWIVVSEQIDCCSGDPLRRKKDPPGLKNALEIISSGKANCMVVFAADRIVRSSQELLALIGRIEKAGGAVASLQDGSDLDTTSDMGELMTFLRGWFSRMELKLIRARTRAGIDRAIAAGRYCGRPKVKLPNRNRVLDLHSKGMGYGQISRTLNTLPSRVRKVVMLEAARARREHSGMDVAKPDAT